MDRYRYPSGPFLDPTPAAPPIGPDSVAPAVKTGTIANGKLLSELHSNIGHCILAATEDQNMKPHRIRKLFTKQPKAAK